MCWACTKQRRSTRGADLLVDLVGDYEPLFADTRDPIYLRRDRSFTILDGNVEALPVCEGIPGGNSMLSWVELETPEGVRFTFYSTHFCVSFAPGGPSSPEGNQRQAIAAAEFMSTNTEPGNVHLRR